MRVYSSTFLKQHNEEIKVFLINLNYIDLYISSRLPPLAQIINSLSDAANEKALAHKSLLS